MTENNERTVKQRVTWGIWMYIDHELRLLPTASIGKRIAAYVLDRLCALFIVLLVGVFSIPLYILVLIGVPTKWVSFTVGTVMIVGVLYVVIWGNWLRVGNNAQTFGMSLAKIAIASEPSQFKSPIINRWFFWVNYAHRNSNTPWAGDEIEERTDAQLWRGLAPTLLFPSIALLILAVSEIIGRLPFILWSLLQGNFSISRSNDFVSTAIAIPILFTLLVALLGPLFAFAGDKRTLVEHFLGIKMVDVSGTKFEQKILGLSGLVDWMRGSQLEPTSK
jgi:uncharacterized RDD family membrane protein YckC